MSARKKEMTEAERQRTLAELRRDVQKRRTGYRERALAIYPHICGRCGREFEGVRLKQLTVHHKDHNHDNNPPDGSNWELLCIYCHDEEHEKYRMAGHGSDASISEPTASVLFNPFDRLDQLNAPPGGPGNESGEGTASA